jgi:uncharacterized membrane protein
MLYALLKLLHLLCVIVWIGGMSFAHFCLRPAALSLPPPLRVPLMRDALGRFFGIVLVAGTLAVASGGVMMWRAISASSQAGVPFNTPLEWRFMAVGGLLMLAIFGHIRFALFKRVQMAAELQNWPVAAAGLNSIRIWVGFNLVLGLLIVAAAVLGTMS